MASRDPMFYLNIIQKMKGEWYNQEGTINKILLNYLVMNQV